MNIRQHGVDAIAPLLILFFSSAAAAQTTDTGEAAPLDRIVVVGTQTDMESARAEAALTPGGIDLLDMDDYRERNVSSLADVLRYVPGVWSASASGNDTIFLSSRGSNLDATDYDMNGIKILQDGLPITTADGNNHNRVVDPLSARHATVARGANGMKYGASTLGGAINFVSITARENPGVEVLLNAGSHRQRLARITAGRSFDAGLDGLLTVESKQWSGFRQHNEQDRLGAYGNLGWQLSDKVETRFYGTWLRNDQEFPGALTRAQIEADPDQANPSAISGHYQKNVDTWRLANNTSIRIDGNRQLVIGFSVEEQSLYHPIVDRVMVDFDGSGPQPPVEVFSLLIDTEHRDVGMVFRYDHQIGQHDLLYGFHYGQSRVSGGHYRNLHGRRNGLSTVIDNDASLLEAFAMDRWRLNDRLTLVLGAQLVSADREVRHTGVEKNVITNPRDDYASLNPRLGVVYDLDDDVSLFANLSRLFEPPTNYQLQDNVAGGDATLEAMKGSVLEIGTRGSRDFGLASSWGWDLSLYYAAIDEEILAVEDPGAPGTSLVTNIDDTVHAGLEATLMSSVAVGSSGDYRLEPMVSLTVNEFTFDDDETYGSNRLPAAPRYAIRGEAIYRRADGYYIGPTFERVGERFADFDNSYRIGAYSLLGLRGGWSNERWSVWCQLVNVLDEDYVASHSVRAAATVSDAILNPGEPQSIYVGIGGRFE
ncbi:MAG: TonB-dependent receptor [Woeseia sp.]